MPSMPKVRDSSGTIGTTRLPIFLSLSSVSSMRTNAIVVENSRSSLLFSRLRTPTAAAPPARPPCGARVGR